MITTEDARQYRLDHQLPLTWDEDIPTPPRDRIEFTRLILQAAQDAGLSVSDLPVFNPYEPETALAVFQKQMGLLTYRQSYNKLPTVSASGWNEFGHWDGYRVLRWHEYIEQLEEDYFKPWKSSWLFGVSAGGEARILQLMKQHISQDKEEFSGGGTYSNALKYPDADTISGNEIIADYLAICDARDIELIMYWKTGNDVELIADCWLGLRGDWIIFVQMGVWVAGFLVTNWLLVTKLYSGWWLLLIIPVLAILGAVGFLFTCNKSQRCWVKSKRTFKSYAAEIVAIKQREWNDLQRIYAII